MAPTPLPSGLTEHEVTFENGAIHLAGTLTLPSVTAGAVKPPVVVLITGSGPQNRNEEVMGFRIFEALAHELGLAGIASLRYDDRGVGASTGDFHASTTADFATDTEAAVRWLKTQGSLIDGAHIGLVGHSEGAMIAPLVASRNAEVRFIVLLAAPAQPIDELLVEQMRRIGRVEGVPEEALAQNIALSRRGFELVKAKEDLRAHQAELGAVAVQQLSTPWFQYFVRYEPLPVLSGVRCPVLAIGGSLDLQVPSDVNLPLIREAMKSANNAHAEVLEIEGMNHLLQAAKTGGVSEYSTLPKRIVPDVPRAISRWVLALASPPVHRH